MFQDFKLQGFHLEDTHLKQAYTLKKLVCLVSIAYAFCVQVGLYYEKHMVSIVKKIMAIAVKACFLKD